jgi:hypothetical protein
MYLKKKVKITDVTKWSTWFKFIRTLMKPQQSTVKTPRSWIVRYHIGHQTNCIEFIMILQVSAA